MFDWKLDCFLCTKPASQDSRLRESQDTVVVRTLEIKETLLRECTGRSDSWTLEVLGRLNVCNDLVADEALYHKACRSKFFNLQAHVMGGKVGRSEDPQRSLRFEQMCDWLDSAEDELFTLSELQEKMRNLSDDGEDVYSTKQIKRKLEDKYGDHIFFSEVCGKKNVICFRNIAASIINDKWYNDRKMSMEDESFRIVTAAAKLIKSQIRESSYQMNEYPLTSDFNDVKYAKTWVPGLLTTFLENLIPQELKQVSIGHWVVQAARPKSVISPVLFGVGVSLDHMFGSRMLLDLLARLGLSISHDEVDRFKQSVVQCDSVDSPETYANAFTQWSGDNVDHNIKTLDGTGTFHGMGIISMTTPCSRQLTWGGVF